MSRTTNFRSYDAQARLLAALVASLENQRFDFKKHRMRTVKAMAEACRKLVEAGEDPAQYAIYEHFDTKQKIQKYFGASTPDGIGFQFRSVKQGAKVLIDAVNNGKDPVQAFNEWNNGGSSSIPATPAGRGAKRARAPSMKKTPGTTPASKRRKQIKLEDITDDEDSPDADYSDLDTTPTKNKPISGAKKINDVDLTADDNLDKPAFSTKSTLNKLVKADCAAHEATAGGIHAVCETGTSSKGAVAAQAPTTDQDSGPQQDDDVLVAASSFTLPPIPGTGSSSTADVSTLDAQNTSLFNLPPARPPIIPSLASFPDNVKYASPNSAARSILTSSAPISSNTTVTINGSKAKGFKPDSEAPSTTVSLSQCQSRSCSKTPVQAMSQSFTFENESEPEVTNSAGEALDLHDTYRSVVRGRRSESVATYFTAVDSATGQSHAGTGSVNFDSHDVDGDDEWDAGDV
ncbi:uncharacterized protein CTHT_0065580 [Thermochaetoides thermophila DSM 1495]|uniref:Uncharacterized protein n=1 Tax=Chaetomium thermophilum (strain DSM 1495 / CBS 144.50 / IMI 039719) TaxID=759272 RepID=G0SGA0_CHATD|nr:hypothetical protein CTHT_0065580 [Thermochaetoides thermophila DSM 1495]EGS17239.1 hypothetical protein CTHT_0065580 [Thermochaetoides thermophila DSM 1495]